MAIHNSTPLYAVAYARFSSELQRDESIDAQIRAIKSYAEREGYVLTAEYVDKAKSATTDQRPEFQRMMRDAVKKRFDIIIIHKLDRFARNRYDSAHYKSLLKRNGIKLRSVTENLDDSPESIVLESVLEGMAEYYSVNLAREVEKGKRENALSGKHTGGIPPLGYDLDRNTMKLVINEREATAVKYIFAQYLKGEGYSSIIANLNNEGYKTKWGKPFGKGSIYEILKNEKYTGVYIYGKSSAKNAEGKYNRHKYKIDSEIIKKDGGVPQIISPEDFKTVQNKMCERKHTVAKHTAKQNYLLSGKIICGECGSFYTGNSRKPRPDHPLYISYRCSKKHGAVACSNPEINRDMIEGVILQRLADKLFDEAVLPQLIKVYSDYKIKQNSEDLQQLSVIEQRLIQVDKGIMNIVKVITKTGSSALIEELTSLEKEQEILKENLVMIRYKIKREEPDLKQLTTSFKKAKQMLQNGTLENKREIIDRYIDRIIIYKEKIDIKVNFNDEYTFKETYRRNN